MKVIALGSVAKGASKKHNSITYKDSTTSKTTYPLHHINHFYSSPSLYYPSIRTLNKHTVCFISKIYKYINFLISK